MITTLTRIVFKSVATANVMNIRRLIVCFSSVDASIRLLLLCLQIPKVAYDDEIADLIDEY